MTPSYRIFIAESLSCMLINLQNMYNLKTGVSGVTQSASVVAQHSSISYGETKWPSTGVLENNRSDPRADIITVNVGPSDP